MCAWYEVIEWHCTCVIFPQTHNLSLTVRKISYKPQLKNILQSIWPVFLKTVAVIKSSESLRNYYSQEPLTEICQVIVSSNGILRQKKEHKVDTKKMNNRMCFDYSSTDLYTNTYPFLGPSFNSLIILTTINFVSLLYRLLLPFRGPLK